VDSMGLPIVSCERREGGRERVSVGKKEGGREGGREGWCAYLEGAHGLGLDLAPLRVVDKQGEVIPV